MPYSSLDGFRRLGGTVLRSSSGCVWCPVGGYVSSILKMEVVLMFGSCKMQSQLLNIFWIKFKPDEETHVMKLV